MVMVELPVCSPLVNSVHKILEQWEMDLKDRLEKFDAAPANYIPGVYIEPSFGTSVTIVKYHTIMDPANTPFTWVSWTFSFLLSFVTFAARFSDMCLCVIRKLSEMLDYYLQCAI